MCVSRRCPPVSFIAQPTNRSLGTKQEIVVVILSTNHQTVVIGFELQTGKPSTLILRLNQETHTDFEVKSEETVATDFEAKPEKTVATGFEAKLEKIVATSFEVKPDKTVASLPHRRTVSHFLSIEPR
jgi:helix-turn-helix protein